MKFRPGNNRYFNIEITFFIVYFYVFRILTDIEYNFWETKTKGLSSEDLQYVFTFGTASLLAFWLLYRCLQYCIHKRSVKLFVATIILFLVAYHFYLKGTHWFFSQLPFLSEEVRKHSFRLYTNKSLGFSIAYIFREILVVCALSYFLYSLKQQEQMRRLKEEKLFSELTYLKAQLQPHFFFNTLNNIYGLALNGSKETAPMVAKLADIMRYILYQSRQDKVTLAEEIDFIRSYVEIERMRHYEHVQINLEIKNEKQDAVISPLLLLPFVENAFKHSTAEATTLTFVDIILITDDENLYFTTRNKKLPATTNTSAQGIGLDNVIKRLNLVYPGIHTLAIQDKEDYFEINLQLKWTV